ncbi:transmembrane protein 223 [Odontomachus brunneus]|uniref:transmembrane protein 223 n=1 Tax=Odontomachus brunneus TaxID=486640 RepID=UPI0013F1ED00|nr:transmembrane protein 223 [Odontomachus brunneus]
MLSTILKHSISMRTLLTDVQSICKLTQRCVRQDKNVFPQILTFRTFLTRNTRLSDGLLQSGRFFKPKMSQNLLVRQQQIIRLDIDTNVKNNVILYKNENYRHTRFLNIFAIAQLIGWSILAIYTYTPSFFDIFCTDINLPDYVNKHIFRLTFFILSIFIGPSAFVVISVLCRRTVRYIILHKGGKIVTLTTSNLWNKDCNMQVPISMIRCVNQRSDGTSVVSLKLKHKSFHYLLETKGTFLNPELFDHTLGYSNCR